MKEVKHSSFPSIHHPYSQISYIMDGISVASSLFGILEAVAVVSSILIKFVKKTKNAPNAARELVSMVQSLQKVNSQLKTYLSSASSVSSSAASLIGISDVQIMVSEYMLAFSELEEVLGTCGNEAEWKILDRLKWVFKEESAVMKSLRRLQLSRDSLSFLLTILNRYIKIAIHSLLSSKYSQILSQTSREISSLRDEIRSFVEQTLIKNPEISQRLQPGVHDSISVAISSGPTANAILQRNDRNESPPVHSVLYTFEDVLQVSRPYLRRCNRDSLISTKTSGPRPSLFSAISLSEVSNISLIAVPVYASDICNSQRYRFDAGKDSRVLTSSVIEGLEERQVRTTNPAKQLKATEENVNFHMGRQMTMLEKQIAPVLNQKTRKRPWQNNLAISSFQLRTSRSSLLRFRLVSPSPSRPTTLGGIFKNAKFPVHSIGDHNGRKDLRGYIPTFLAESGKFIRTYG